MILSGNEILKERSNGNIFISDFNSERLNPNSYNLRLHNELLVYNDPVLDMKKENSWSKVIIPDDGYILMPNKLYLGRTVEMTETKNYVPMLEGRSSVGRLGICIHVTAGFGDVGFCGYWTLELFCIQPVKIYPNVEICQIYYHDVSDDHFEYKSGKYQNNNGIQASRMFMDFIK